MYKVHNIIGIPCFYLNSKKTIKGKLKTLFLLQDFAVFVCEHYLYSYLCIENSVVNNLTQRLLLFMKNWYPNP